MSNNDHSLPEPGQEYSTSLTPIHAEWREKFVLTTLRIACVIGAALLWILYPNTTTAGRIFFACLYFLLLAISVIRSPYSIRAYGLLLLIFILGIFSMLAWGPWLGGSLFFISLIILSALLFDQRIIIPAFIISLITISLTALLQQLGVIHLQAPYAPLAKFADWTIYIINFITVSAVLIAAITQYKDFVTHTILELQKVQRTFDAERAQLEYRVRVYTDEIETRALQSRFSASISRTITEIRDISELFDSVTEQISEQFGFYQVGLYLLDERKKIAFLQASSAAAGKQLIGQGFNVEPSRTNLFNLVIEHKRPHITLESDIDFVRDKNFPLTHSRMMLPLKVRGNVIGLMDVHSDQQASFNFQQAEALQSVADLVAIAFDNVRLINETKNLTNQLESTASLQTHETWTKFTSRHKPAYQFTPAGVRPLFAKNKPEDSDGMHIPLILHGQKIGGIVLKRKGVTAAWSDRERILVEKIADQVALALENSRLVDETQKNALRNQVIANISNRVRETLDVESVVRTATTELRRVFDLKEAEVSIGAPLTDGKPIKKHTSSLRLK